MCRRPQAQSHRPRPQVAPAAQQRGRGRGFTSASVDVMLDLAEEHLPVGQQMWDELALKFNEAIGENCAGEDVRNKIKNLKNSRKPTADQTCPPQVRRETQIG